MAPRALSANLCTITALEKHAAVTAKSANFHKSYCSCSLLSSRAHPGALGDFYVALTGRAVQESPGKSLRSSRHFGPVVKRISRPTRFVGVLCTFA